MTEIILPFLEAYGLPGAVIAYQFWTNSQKDKRLSEVTDKFIDKSVADATRDAETTQMLNRIVTAVEARR